MITRRTKVQLVIFVVITLLGVSFVGARYAQLDRFLVDDSYNVTAHFADSGGIFAGAEVTYRGLTVGRVESLRLTGEGVDVDLAIDNAHDAIPARTDAVVGNRSAVGEQYVELQPSSDDEPYLEDGSEIEQSATRIPIQPTEWLDNTQRLVNSVPQQDLNTVVGEFGQAFKDGGDDLGTLIDSQDSFIRAASDNLDLTRRLLRDSNVVLSTQLDKASAIRSFARDLAAFSDTLASSDRDLRRIIANGSATAGELRSFLEENEVDLGRLISNLVVTGEVQVKHLAGIKHVLIVYPYVVAHGLVVADNGGSGPYDAHFGLVLTTSPVCRKGYESTDRREPSDGSNRRMNEDARCSDPDPAITPRGSRFAPRVAPAVEAGQPGVDARVVGTYDRSTGKVAFGEPASRVVYTGGAAAQYGDQSWMQLLLQPVLP